MCINTVSLPNVSRYGNRSIYCRGVGAKLEVVRENFSLLASFVITIGASVYYSCQRQLMLGGSGGMNFYHLRCHSRPFWAKLVTNIDPAIAMYNYS